MGHDDECRFKPLLNVDKLELRVLAEFLVERGKRLVEKKQLRPAREGAGKRHPLALAARQLVRLAAAHAGQPDKPQQFGHPALDLGARQTGALQAVGDVAVDRHMREQRVILEHDVDRACCRRHTRHVDAVDFDAA